MARAWRVVKRDYAASALSGDGARRAGGRWNPQGVAAIYASDSLALAMLEVLVHFDSAMPMADYLCFELDLPDEKIVTFGSDLLPLSWPGRESIPLTQRHGSSMLIARSAFILRVPSAVVEPEFNYVINPSHPEFLAWLPAQLARAPRPLSFDPRLASRRAATA